MVSSTLSNSPAEFYISCVPLALIGLMMNVMATINLCCDCAFGSFGRFFKEEMDGNMGGLLGIPHFSKVEAFMLYIAGTTMWASWVKSDIFNLITVIGCIFMFSYMIICFIYGKFARQPSVPYLVVATIGFGMGVWRMVRFLKGEYHLVVYIIFGVSVMTSIISFFVMKANAPKREWFIAQFIKI